MTTVRQTGAIREAVTGIVAAIMMHHTALAAGPMIEGCPIFPETHVLNTPIDSLPVHSNSATWISTIGVTNTLHPDFGVGSGIPYLVVTSNEAPIPVTFTYADESDPGPYPIPTNAPVEGGSGSTGDRHVLALDKDGGKLYEMFSAYPVSNSWQAGSGAIFDLRGCALRTDTWTSADAAGLPILPLLVRYDEIAAGEIKHAIRFTAPKTQRQYLWPARHYASTNTSNAFPPMGARLRLKADYNISGFDATNRVILQALKKYGMILADNGSAWFITGAPDSRFDDSRLYLLSSVTGGCFEVVDCSYLMTNVNSGGALSPAPVFRSADTGTNGFSFSAELLPALSHQVERKSVLSSTGDWSLVETLIPSNGALTTRTYPFDATNTWFYRIRR